MSEPLRIWIIAGEESGDQLGGKLMAALRARAAPRPVAFAGVGGERMSSEGLEALFPMSDIAVMGLTAVIARLPTLLNRIARTVEAVVAAKPDILVVIDSPDFTHRVAKAVRRRCPQLPIVNYVSPTVWAWRPGRARKMRPYTDHLLALLPFEPAAHERLGGPTCTYVGHPLTERLADLRPAMGERRPIGSEPVELVVLPGSRHSEVRRLMGPFGQAIGLLAAELRRPFAVTLPAVTRHADEIRALAASWPVQPKIVLGEADKLAAFRRAHLALAASGTVTLELALAQVPMVVGYRVSTLEEQLQYVITAHSIVLANLILGENVVPELIQHDCTPERLAAALRPLLADGPERRGQMSAFERLDAAMRTDEAPSERAARIVLSTLEASSR